MVQSPRKHLCEGCLRAGRVRLLSAPQRLRVSRGDDETGGEVLQPVYWYSQCFPFSGREAALGEGAQAMWVRRRRPAVGGTRRSGAGVGSQWPGQRT